jgi:hypothetical protein
VKSTQVDGSVFPMLDNVSVPVQEAMELLRGPAATMVEADMLFLDDSLSVMRTQDLEIFVYGRI